MTNEDLSARLASVERSNRRMRGAGIAALVLVAAVVAIGQAAPAEKVIRTRLVEIVDDKDVVRATLGMTEAGDTSVMKEPALTLFNETGTNQQATLRVTWTGRPVLSMADGNVQGALRIAGSGKFRGLRIQGKDQSTAWFGTNTGELPILDMRNADGTVLLSVPK